MILYKYNQYCFVKVMEWTDGVATLPTCKIMPQKLHVTSVSSRYNSKLWCIIMHGRTYIFFQNIKF
jgi:hypothetical protein